MRVYSLTSMNSFTQAFRNHVTDAKTVIGARDISKVPHSPALYVRLLSSGNKLWKTEIIRNSAPLWEHMYPLWVFLPYLFVAKGDRVR